MSRPEEAGRLLPHMYRLARIALSALVPAPRLGAIRIKVYQIK